jgi:hypothetical protein
MQARISTSAVIWAQTLARVNESPLYQYNDLSGDDLVREIVQYRWSNIISMAHATRRLEAKERTKRMDELLYGSYDEQIAHNMVKKLDEADKLRTEDLKQRKLEARERKREAWSRRGGK